MIICTLCGHELMDIAGVVAEAAGGVVHVRVCNTLTLVCADTSRMPVPPELLGLEPVFLRARSRAYGKPA